MTPLPPHHWTPEPNTTHLTNKIPPARSTMAALSRQHHPHLRERSASTTRNSPEEPRHRNRNLMESGANNQRSTHLSPPHGHRPTRVSHLPHTHPNGQHPHALNPEALLEDRQKTHSPRPTPHHGTHCHTRRYPSPNRDPPVHSHRPGPCPPALHLRTPKQHQQRHH